MLPSSLSGKKKKKKRVQRENITKPPIVFLIAKKRDEGEVEGENHLFFFFCSIGIVCHFCIAIQYV